MLNKDCEDCVGVTELFLEYPKYGKSKVVFWLEENA